MEKEIKDEFIIIRVSKRLKKAVLKKSKSKGLSAYLRPIIDEAVSNEKN